MQNNQVVKESANQQNNYFEKIQQFQQEQKHQENNQPKNLNVNKQKSQEDAGDEERIRFNQLHPAQQKVVKHGALQFDIKLGWVPKAQITGPIPIAFAHPQMDDLISQNIPVESILYLGYRPTNSFQLHKSFYKDGQNYPFNQFHLCKSQFLQRFFKKYYSDFEYDSKRKLGMLIQSPLVFQSFFQGGNLDAVYFDQQQYKLVLRPDTNTRGHCNYYYFRVKCKVPKKYTFRLVNMSKSKSLYQRGMKPYIRTKQNPIWSQGCSNVRFGPSQLCTQYELRTKMSSLKFEFEFTGKQEWVQFCYGIPFLYSDLLHLLNNFRSNPNFHLNKLCYSLSGLQIPLVTITQPEKQSKPQKQQKQKNNKYIIALAARVHPGETHGSHIINGFMKSLLSNKSEAQMLRKNIIFKIVPMINPDGVVVGNTRTSFSGKDLNRVYSDKTDFVFPQVIGIRDFTQKMKQKYKKKFLFFIDIHGHSTRRNSFFFGPQYSVFDQQYTKCRLLAKIFANVTDIFRYYSCKFRLSSFKQKTCRGYFNSNNIIRTYTYQTSMDSYFDFTHRKESPFTQQKLQQLGNHLMIAIYQYVNVTIKLQPIPVPEPVDKKKLYLKAYPKQEQEQENSDEIPSEKADSQDSADDLNMNHLQVFYNRINQNRQYFFEQLMQFNNLPFTKAEKKIKKKQIVQNEQKVVQFPQRDNSKKQQIPAQPIKKNLKTKVEWMPKYDFKVKKKQFLQYQKLSNVIFGSTDINSMVSIKDNLLYTSRQSLSSINQPKYTFINPTFSQQLTKTINSQRKYQSLNKNQDSKLQSKARFFNNSKQYLSLKETSTIFNRNNSKSKLQQNINEHQDLIMMTSRHKKIYKNENLDKLILEPKQLDILVQNQSIKVFKEDLKSTKVNLRSTSLRVLPRKKSIKNFRNSNNDEKVSKKVAKNMSQKGLATKLPYISKLICQF